MGLSTHPLEALLPLTHPPGDQKELPTRHPRPLPSLWGSFNWGSTLTGDLTSWSRWSPSFRRRSGTVGAPLLVATRIDRPVQEWLSLGHLSRGSRFASLPMSLDKPLSLCCALPRPQHQVSGSGSSSPTDAQLDATSSGGELNRSSCTLNNDCRSRSAPRTTLAVVHVDGSPCWKSQRLHGSRTQRRFSASLRHSAVGEELFPSLLGCPVGRKSKESFVPRRGELLPMLWHSSE